MLAEVEAEVTVGTEDDPYRVMIREMIYDGLADKEWSWLQAIAPALRLELDAENDHIINFALVKSIINEAEDQRIWPKGFSESSLAEARAAVRSVQGVGTYHRCPARGELISTHVLTEARVRAIRRSRKSIKELAAYYSVSEKTISRVKRKVAWKHVK